MLTNERKKQLDTDTIQKTCRVFQILAKVAMIRTAYGFRNLDNPVAMVMLTCSGFHPKLPGR